MLSDAFLSHHKVSVNERYVFFTSLQNAKLAEYINIYNQGMGYLNAAGQQLNATNLSNNSAAAETMLSYINLIGQIAQTERANETEFVQKFESILSEDQQKLITNDLRKMISNLDTDFNYPDFIGLLNLMLRENNDFSKARDKIAQESLEVIHENYKNASAKTQKDLEEAYYIENYGKYMGIASKTLLKMVTGETEEQNKKFQSQATAMLAQRFNSVISNITSSSEILEMIKDSWTGPWSAAELQKQIVSVVLNYLVDLDFETLATASGAELAQQISQQYTQLAEKVNDQIAENALKIMTKKSIKTLEEVALTTRTGLGKMFLDLEKSEQRKTINLYKAYGFDLSLSKIQQLCKDNEKQARATITTKLGEAIRKRAENEFKKTFNERSGAAYAAQKVMVAELQANNPKFFQQRKNKENIENLLQIKVTGPSLAEYITSTDFQKHINNGSVFLPGHSIVLKTDASVSFFYEPIEVSPKQKKLQNKIQPLLDNWEKNFLTAYKAKTSGRTDVAAAAEIFENQSKNITNIIKANLPGEKNQAEVTKLIEKLNNFVSMSISIKDYNFGSSDLGFIGGSLGPSGKMLDGVATSFALQNIVKMYELGGISNIDVDLLYFVLLNCGPDGIANGLKTNLETFLLGGAAMMMFDDGFATANAFIARMTKELQLFIPKTIHLYQVQGKYIPASLIYSSIYNALLSAYQTIVSTADKLTSIASIANKVTIINNTAESNYNWDFKTTDSNAQDRFDKVQADAIGNIDIRFSFLGGILDVFQSIPQAFANI